jgi:uncharacterized membrane protein
MKSVLTSAALALMVASQCQQHVGAFAPTSRVQPRIQNQPNLLQRRMVMDRPDPMDLEVSSKKSTDPTPFFVSLFQNMKEQDKVPMKVAAVALGMALALMPLQANAAMSGGRMGGSYSRPRQSMSRPMPSRSSSYSRGYSGGYSSGYYSRPSVAITPGYGFGYSPFGFGGGFGGGGYYGGSGVVSVARGPSFFDLLLVGGLLYAATNVLSNVGSEISSSSGMSWADSAREMSSLGPGTSVVQLSVAIEVPDRDDPNSMLSILSRLSQTARTDSRVGIQNLTSQVAIELLRRKASIVSASSEHQHYGDRAKAGRDYESRSIRERSKFERESISKYGGVDYGTNSPSLGSGLSSKATMAVVTLVMAIDGDSTKVPKINSISSVEDALRLIAANSKVDDCLQSVEILWTPEERTETLSVRDVVADYPELRSV